jgi:hypothetical protein
MYDLHHLYIYIDGNIMTRFHISIVLRQLSSCVPLGAPQQLPGPCYYLLTKENGKNVKSMQAKFSCLCTHTGML